MTPDPVDVACGRWPDASVAALLDEHEIAVCSASLRASDDRLAEALRILDRDELVRYERHLNADVARRFAVGRMQVREMLGAVLSMEPAAVPIRIGLHGKPSLDRAAHTSGLRFSVAHCEDLLVVALTRAGDVGIDVERVRAVERWTRVADRVFDAADRAELGAAIAAGHAPAHEFFRFWCRTEAELKAIGSGIAGLGAHRDGWRPPGLRVVELPELPLPADHHPGDARYQCAVALCTPRDATARQTAFDASQARMPSITPASPSTA